jgi:hypothetical protein
VWTPLVHGSDAAEPTGAAGTPPARRLHGAVAGSPISRRATSPALPKNYTPPGTAVRGLTPISSHFGAGNGIVGGHCRMRNGKALPRQAPTALTRLARCHTVGANT